MSTRLPQLLNILSSDNEELAALSFSKIITFSLIIIRLKEQLSWYQSCTTTNPPFTLPPKIVAFCSDSLGTNHEVIHGLWDSLREVVWYNGVGDEDEELLRNKRLLGLFLRYGAQYQIGQCEMLLYVWALMDNHAF